jgi:hypothetical protein
MKRMPSPLASQTGLLGRVVPPGTATFIAALMLALPGSAAASTVKVRNQHDAGPGSLRSALVNARDGETILVPAGTYQLKSQLFIQASVTVVGAGPAKTILTAGAKSRVIDVNNALSTVTLEQLAVTHGKAATGGGILNTANLKLRHVAVSENLAAGGAGDNVGGGIANSGELTIEHSKISDNKTAPGKTQGRGAGIADAVTGGGTLKISRTSITGNVAQGQGIGGALFFEPIDPPDGTEISITTSTISNNKALGSNVLGGGIFYEPVPNSGSPRLPVTLTRDTFSGNVADGGSDQARGGALFYGPISNTAADLPLTMVNDTFTANRAGNPNAMGTGGGLEIEPVINDGSAALNFTNLTIAHNVSEGPDASGGGVFYAPVGTFSATFTNVIIGLNKAASGPDCSQNVPSSGHNLESHTGCGFSNGAGDIQNTNPLLGPLTNNGGPTETLALLRASPAINAGDDTACPPIDQRAVSRPQGPHCDIGAFEQRP